MKYFALRNTLIIGVIASLLFNFQAFAQPGIKWYSPTRVEGICQTDTANIFHRLPAALEKQVREPVWKLSLQTAGEFIDFTSSAQDIIVKYHVTGNFNMPHMPSTGVSGVSLWAIDKNGVWKWAPGSYKFGDTVTYTYHNLVFSRGAKSHFRLYLPLYNTVSWMSIGVKSSESFSFNPPIKDKPIVAYGTSIMQGAVASRPDLTWTNILNRMLNCPVINLGFSGNGRIEAPVIDVMAAVDARLYIIDCIPNLTRSTKISTDEISHRVDYAVTKLRERNKNVPILFADHSGGYAANYMDTARANGYKLSSMVMEKIFNRLITTGVKNVYLLTDKEIGFDENSTAEGLHPNDIGMMLYAKAYEKKIRQILKGKTY